MDTLTSGATDRPKAAPVLGYLNFSDGRPDPRWQRQLDDAFAVFGQLSRQHFVDWLLGELDRLAAEGSAAFRDGTQAKAVLRLAFLDVPTAYRAHHVDLLGHAAEVDLFNGFFLARCAEAVLAQGSPWDEHERIVTGALARLNDFVGHRPVAVLEGRPAAEYYPHERFRPIPVFLRGAGVAHGRWSAVVNAALELLRDTDPAILGEACFDLNCLDELAVDPRAYDHTHPVNRRPNYAFGEWDPHHLDAQGRYRRMVIRQSTLDALLERVPAPNSEPARLVEERLFEAAAVLAGTVLMASGVSGSGPDTHDSGTTLATLVPRIARYRDAFYTQLLERQTGPLGDRLRAEAAQFRQPFGAARHHLNQAMTQQRAAQLQEKRLALIFAEMGYPEVGRQRAHRISTASVRLLTELRIRQTEGHRAVARGQIGEAVARLVEAEALLHRGIDCGALVDPWNVLGFQGLFPVFQAREDSVRDPRVEELIDGVARQLDLYARVLSATASASDTTQQRQITQAMRGFADWWDRFATHEVSDVTRVHGGERAEAAEHVAESLAAWQARDPATPAISFWRTRREGFRSPAAFVRVVEALLSHGDSAAAMALLMAWLAEAESIPLEEGPHSFHDLAERWLAHELSARAGASVRKFFELLEANADSFWEVPELTLASSADGADESSFESAYEGVTFRDSADDGEEGALLGDGTDRPPFALEEDAPMLERRLRFVATVARLWQRTARAWAAPVTDPQETDQRTAALRDWRTTAQRHLHRLNELLLGVSAVTVPEPLPGIEAVVEFERQRGLKEQLLEAALHATLETDRAVRLLTAAVTPSQLPPIQAGSAVGWEELSLPLERALVRGDREAVRQHLPAFLDRFRHEPLLFIPVSEGGAPGQILRARRARVQLQSLLDRLPRLGLLRETFALIKLARQMEQNAPTEGRKVTEFDRLFAIALQAVVEALLDSADTWPAERTGPSWNTGSMRVDWLRRVVDSFLSLWISHSQTLRLSAMETVSEDDWRRSRDFSRTYGGELFHARFLSLANLRGVLHRGVRAWLDSLAELPEGERPRLADDLERRRMAPERAVRLLELILQAVAENYEEYRDYNSTTTQSDYGENLFVLLDFLRVKAAYDRYAWRMRPLVQAHEVLCRRHRPADALKWQGGIADFTRRLSEQLLEDLARREQEHAVRLRTIRDRLEERFVRPLAVDRLCAEVKPAMDEASDDPSGRGPAFSRLLEQVEALAAVPSGAGLDVPQWLRRLEAEVVKTQQPPQPELDIPRRPLSLPELQRELEEWDRPYLGG